MFDHTNQGSTTYATRLLGGNTNEVYGLAKSLSVMPGDTISIKVFAKYIDRDESSGWTTALQNLMAAIATGTAPVGTLVDGGATGSIGTATPGYTSVLDKATETGTAPKAYLNYIVFDRDFNPILSESGFKRVTAAAKENGSDIAHERLFKENLVIREPGYVYIYLSNENDTPVEVFFDDFRVEHIQSPVVQVDDYYPFGFTFNGYQRENGTPNKFKFQGQEHIDDLDLGWDSFKWRNHQPDIGRFFNLDPLAEKYVYNSPYAFSENKVVAHVELEGLEAVGIEAIDMVDAMVPKTQPTGGGKVLSGVGNVVFGSVGAIGSALYVEGTIGLGAALGGGTAFALSLGEVAIGITQIVDGISEMNGGNSDQSGILENSSSIPGLLGNAAKLEHAPWIDAAGQFVPGMLSGGNLNALKDGWSVIKSSENTAQATQNVLSTVDAALDTKGVVDATLQEIEKNAAGKKVEEKKESQ